jgi:hypothetical protein
MNSPSAHSRALHKNESRKCRSENVFHVFSVPMLHFQSKVNSIDDTSYSQYSVFFYNVLVNCWYFILNSKKEGWQNWICKLGHNFKFPWCESLCTLCATCTLDTSYYYVTYFNFTGECFVNSDIWCCRSVNSNNQWDTWYSLLRILRKL